MKHFTLIAAATLVAGCAGAPNWVSPRAAPEGAPFAQALPAAAMPAASTVPPGARTVEQFDTTSAVDKARATQPAAGGTDLGTTTREPWGTGSTGVLAQDATGANADRGARDQQNQRKIIRRDLDPHRRPCHRRQPPVFASDAPDRGVAH